MRNIIDTIAGMRDRKSLADIINTATARDNELMKLESSKTSKRVFSQYDDVKAGDLLYIHNMPRTSSRPLQLADGRPLTVLRVLKRAKRIEVIPSGRKDKIKLSWSVLDRYKVSKVPTAAALAFTLNGGEP